MDDGSEDDSSSVDSSSEDSSEDDDDSSKDDNEEGSDNTNSGAMNCVKSSSHEAVQYLPKVVANILNTSRTNKLDESNDNDDSSDDDSSSEDSSEVDVDSSKDMNMNSGNNYTNSGVRSDLAKSQLQETVQYVPKVVANILNSTCKKSILGHHSNNDSSEDSESDSTILDSRKCGVKFSPQEEAEQVQVPEGFTNISRTNLDNSEEGSDNNLKKNQYRFFCRRSKV